MKKNISICIICRHERSCFKINVLTFNQFICKTLLFHNFLRDTLIMSVTCYIIVCMYNVTALYMAWSVLVLMNGYVTSFCFVGNNWYVYCYSMPNYL